MKDLGFDLYVLIIMMLDYDDVCLQGQKNQYGY